MIPCAWSFASPQSALAGTQKTTSTSLVWLRYDPQPEPGEPGLGGPVQVRFRFELVCAVHQVPLPGIWGTCSEGICSMDRYPEYYSRCAFTLVHDRLGQGLFFVWHVSELPGSGTSPIPPPPPYKDSETWFKLAEFKPNLMSFGCEG